jgi:hypothetical protein
MQIVDVRLNFELTNDKKIRMEGVGLTQVNALLHHYSKF